MNEKVKKAMPTILTCLSCVGVGLTTWLMHENTKKDVLNLMVPNKDISTKDRVIIYLPTIISGVVTMATIIFNNKTSKAQIASMAAATGISTKLFNEYRQKAVEVLGVDTVKDIEKQVVRDHEDEVVYCVSPYISADGFLGCSNDQADDGDVLFYEPFGQKWIRTSKEAVRLAWYCLNRNFALGMVATMASFYEFLGIKPEEADKDYGWGLGFLEDGMCWIDMDLEKSQTEHGEDYYIINYHYMPEFLVDGEDY